MQAEAEERRERQERQEMLEKKKRKEEHLRQKEEAAKVSFGTFVPAKLFPSQMVLWRELEQLHWPQNILTRNT